MKKIRDMYTLAFTEENLLILADLLKQCKCKDNKEWCICQNIFKIEQDIKQKYISSISKGD